MATLFFTTQLVLGSTSFASSQPLRSAYQPRPHLVSGEICEIVSTMGRRGLMIVHLRVGLEYSKETSFWKVATVNVALELV